MLEAFSHSLKRLKKYLQVMTRVGVVKEKNKQLIWNVD